MATRDRPEYDRLLTAIRDIRHERGLTQREVANRLGTYQEWINRSETGERRLDAVELYDIARALDVDLAEILRRAGLIGRHRQHPG
ncbi:XRE family transcriptional regulator [Actinobacteria bacterium YIM 96077]|uniref:Transcriptional regulator n=1 Tax=Phytoactinopolyspora halophila TaxID=1981511 RepID=A0A329R2U3_9ACTN|nr:XRE family transcriptional regulator [Actinobacteria bacterium YIM 96077]RAW18861.1 transcriptional regulator [Phytoactinopolyspora halophila]